MKGGDTIQVRLIGDELWSDGKIAIISDNQKSIAIYGEGLPSISRGMTLHPQYGKCILLLREENRPVYDDVFTGNKFEIKGVE
jgi:hypothetical protein